MPLFKKKNTKIPKLSKKNLITLDGKHREFISEFNRDKLINIPKLKAEKQGLKEKLENSKNIE